MTFLDTGPFTLVDEDGHRESIQWEFTNMRESIMRESMKNILSFVVTALLVGTLAHAQVHAQETTDEIDTIFS